MSGGDPAFLADAMLGKLARWLALMGYDARLAGSERSDLELLAEASREGRVFLTRDRRIPAVAGLRQVLIADAVLEAQLKQIFAELGLRPDPARWFTRCLECNEPLETIPREQALARVPLKVRELDTAFRRCAACGRLYWDGTHVERARAKLSRWGFGAAAQSPDAGSGGSAAGRP